MTTTDQSDLRERLAAIEHERWADWQAWVHKVINEGVEGSTLEQFMERWEKQIATPYDQLSDAEKASDMEQVDRYWPLIEKYVAAEVTKARADELKKVLDEWHWDDCEAHELEIQNRLAELTNGKKG